MGLKGQSTLHIRAGPQHAPKQPGVLGAHSAELQLQPPDIGSCGGPLRLNQLVRCPAQLLLKTRNDGAAHGGQLRRDQLLEALEALPERSRCGGRWWRTYSCSHGVAELTHTSPKLRPRDLLGPEPVHAALSCQPLAALERQS